jgi:hypothetical protein
VRGKGVGTGAMAPNVPVIENRILSNRDKAQHSKDRGQDAKWVQAEQLHDSELWPAPGSEDTELGVLMGPEVRHGEAEVHARVQA